MKKLILAALLIVSYTTMFAQDGVSKKPHYVIIAQNQVVSMEKVNEYGQGGYIKTMSKGVSQQTRDSLANIYGDTIKDKEFIIIVSLFNEQERQERMKIAPATQKTGNKSIDAGTALINTAAKDVEITRLDGKSIKLSQLKGKVVLLNFWATWCAPCLMEFYDIPSKIIEPLKGTDFVFLPVSAESIETITARMEKLKKDNIVFDVFADKDSIATHAYNITVIPQNFVIDKTGTIRYTSSGNVEGNLDAILKEIKTLLTN